MGVSETSLCNAALAKLGEDGITSLTDASKAARACNEAYARCRDWLLRRHPWNFAETLVALPALATAPAWGYARAFQLPADFLRLLEIDGNPPYRLIGRTIHSDTAAPLKLRYTAQITDPNAFDVEFREVLALKIAVEICETVTGSTARVDSLERRLKQLLGEARNTDGQENLPEELPDDDWFLAREAD